MRKMKILFLPLAACALLAAPAIPETLVAAAAGSGTAASGAPDQRSVPEAPADYQTSLLNLAIDTASAIPVEPHVKDRSRVQEDVVVIALELDRPELALEYANRIENWRQAHCQAMIAVWFAENGEHEKAEELAKKAALGAAKAESWRRDRIRARVAQAKALMGNDEAAASFASNLEPAETGKVAQAKARVLTDDEFDTLAAELDALIASEHMDMMRNGLNGWAEIYSGHYQNEERRTLAEERMREGWKTMPVFIQLELVKKMARTAIDQDDMERARALADEAQSFMTDYNWPFEYYLQNDAPVKAIRHAAGDESAHGEALALIDEYQEREEEIGRVFRAGSLRPLGQALEEMGDREGALRVYRLALEIGAANWNQRPAAMDTARTAASMALAGTEPDTEFMERLRQINERLSEQ